MQLLNVSIYYINIRVLFVGVSGPPGRPGMDGVRGQPGLKGEAGATGMIGMPGLKGDRGVPGVDCTKGTKVLLRNKSGILTKCKLTFLNFVLK